MSSSLSARLAVQVGGQLVTFATPFTPPFLETEEDAAIYDVTIAADSSGTLWEGAPLPPTFDFIAILSDLDIDVEFVVNGGEADEYHFTVPVLASFPLVIPGGTSFAGQTGTEDAFVNGTRRNITQVNANNANTTDTATVKVCIAREAA